MIEETQAVPAIFESHFPTLMFLLQVKGEKKTPDYQSAVIHGALYPPHEVHRLPQPADIMIMMKSTNCNKSGQLLVKEHFGPSSSPPQCRLYIL